MAKKVDRRVRYTKMVLKNSLAELLEEKTIEKITVKEICEKADINRGTFYSHYSDQFDLYNGIVDELLEEGFIKLGNFMELDEDGLTAAITNVFEYIKENADIVRILLKGGVEYSIEQRIRNVIKNIYLNKIDKDVDMDYINFTYSFIAAGSISLIRSWVSSDTPKAPHEVAVFIRTLTGSGLKAIL